MLIAHAPVAFLANYFLLKEKIERYSNEQQLFLYASTLLFGILPDFDIFLLIIAGVSPNEHHKHYMHFPITWIILYFVLLYAYKFVKPKIKVHFNKLVKDNYIETYLQAFLIGTLSHIFADTFFGNINYLYPLTSNAVTLLARLFPDNLYAGYMGHPGFAIELIIVGLFIVVATEQIFKTTVFARKFLKVIFIALPVTYLLFNTWVYKNIYSFSFPYDKQGHQIYDKDSDTLIDNSDPDVDNDFIDNIQDANHEEISLSLSVSSRYRSVPTVNKISKEGFMHNTLYEFGAIDSYRFVDMVYFMHDTPLDAVVRAHRIKHKKLENKENMEVLYDYFEKKKQIVNIDNASDLKPAQIVFVLDKSGKVLNVGIVDIDSIRTVADEKFVSSFSLEELREEYKEEVVFKGQRL